MVIALLESLNQNNLLTYAYTKMLQPDTREARQALNIDTNCRWLEKKT